MRLRFAPSPTGQIHVGNARTALLNWLMARGAGATFVLRIEDTDFARSTKEAEGSAIDDVRWLGLNWEEGGVAGDAHGPYRQSERLHIYRAHAVELMSKEQAYYCFCSEEQLEMDRYQALRNMQPPKYVGRCRNLSREDARKRIEAGETAVIRFRVPEGDRELASLPEALANYLALIGWSPGENQELLSLEELAKRFRIEDVGKSAGVFDPEKLAWVNRHYLKLAAPARLAELALPFLERHGWINRDSGSGESKGLDFVARGVGGAAQSVRCLHPVPGR